MIITVVLILCTISFMINALGEAKYYAHGGKWHNAIMIVNLGLAAVSAALLVYRVGGGT